MPLIGAGFQGVYPLIYWHTNAAPPIKGIFIFKNMLKDIFLHGTNERFPVGEELDKELMVQADPPKGKPYVTSAFYSHDKGFWKENRSGVLILENVVAWALMPDPTHHF